MQFSFTTPLFFLTIASLRDEMRMNLRCMSRHLGITDFSKNTFWMKMSCATQTLCSCIFHSASLLLDFLSSFLRCLAPFGGAFTLCAVCTTHEPNRPRYVCTTTRATPNEIGECTRVQWESTTSPIEENVSTNLWMVVVSSFCFSARLLASAATVAAAAAFSILLSLPFGVLFRFYSRRFRRRART